MASRRRRRRLRDGHYRRAAYAPLPRAPRRGSRRAREPDAGPGSARPRAGGGRRAHPARDARVERRCRRSAGARAAHLVRPRGRRAALALADRGARARAGGGDDVRQPVRRRRPPAPRRGQARSPRADRALHVAERPRRAVRRRRSGGRFDRGRLRLRGRLPRGRCGVPAGRGVVPGRAGARGGGARAQRPGGPVGRRHVRCRARGRADTRGARRGRRSARCHAASRERRRVASPPTGGRARSPRGRG